MSELLAKLEKLQKAAGIADDDSGDENDDPFAHRKRQEDDIEEEEEEEEELSPLAEINSIGLEIIHGVNDMKILADKIELNIDEHLKSIMTGLKEINDIIQYQKKKEIDDSLMKEIEEELRLEEEERYKKDRKEELKNKMREDRKKEK